MGGNKFVAIDIETTGLDWLKDKILCVGSSDGAYFSGPNLISEFKVYLETLKGTGATIVGQNMSFDCKFLWAAGVKIENTWDTMVAAYLLKNRPIRLGLDSLVAYYLGLPSHKEDIKSGAIFENPELMKIYCLTDCEYTAKLAEVLEKRLEEEGRLEFFYKLMEARRMLTRAEYRGVAFDSAANDRLIEDLKGKVDHQLRVLGDLGAAEVGSYKQAFPKAKTFNFNSPKQVLWLLKHLGLNTVNPLTKKESADITVLEGNASKHPLITQLIEMRQTKKLLSTLESYKESVRVDGALHPSFNCTNTRTGRLSSSGDLNIQQVDRSPKIRALFTARPGYKLVIGDLAQIEPRLAAHYSKDPVLTEMFKNEEDLYGTIAVQLLGADCAPNEVKTKYPDKRSVAKVIGLSVLYGIGTNKLRNTIENDGGVKGFTLEAARGVIRNYFEKFSGLRGLQIAVQEKIARQGFLTNYYGRRVDVSPDDAFMQGVNSLIQSSASDYMMFKTVEFTAMTKCSLDYAYRLSKLLMLVHDEAVYEVPEHITDVFSQQLQDHMEQANFRIPIKFAVTVGDTWAAKS